MRTNIRTGASLWRTFSYIYGILSTLTSTWRYCLLECGKGVLFFWKKKIERTIKLYELKMSAQSSFILILSDYLTLRRYLYSKKKRKEKNRIILEKQNSFFFSSNTLPNLLYRTENNAGNCKHCTNQSWIYMDGKWRSEIFKIHAN